MARVYNDSKTFVDKRLLAPENVILERYRLLKNSSDNQTRTPSRDQLAQFIDQYFADDPLEKWTPVDMSETPSIYYRVRDEEFKKWILSLNKIWAELAGRVSEQVQQSPNMHSIIYMPNGFIKVKISTICENYRYTFPSLIAQS